MLIRKFLFLWGLQRGELSDKRDVVHGLRHQVLVPDLAMVLWMAFGLLQELWQGLPEFALLELFQHYLLQLLQIGFLVR